jgi:hypothetical protein
MRRASLGTLSGSGMRAVLAGLAAVALLVALLPAAEARETAAGGGQDRSESARPLGPPAHAAADRDLRLEVASGRADTVVGGDALVRVHVPRTVPPHRVRVSVIDDDGERDVTGAFELEESGSLLGVVDGLELGESVLRASGPGRGHGGAVDELVVTNHPVHGPVFSGPHQQPFFCDPAESGLGSEWDEYCHVAEPMVEYFYRRASTGQFLPLDDPASTPTDVAMTTTSEGHEVPFIVRNERGTLNRGIYNIAVLHHPDEPAWGDPLRPQPQWNQRLYYQLEGACRPGYTQDRERAQDILSGGQVDVLGAGFAVARHTFSRHGNACGNDVLTSESMMMVREHFTVTHGEPLHMIGNGGSGGAILQYLTADNYPGILDGIIASSTFPDAYSIASGAGDAALLNRAFADSDLWPEYDWTTVGRFPNQWSPTLEAALAPLTAVSGWGSWAINLTWVFGNTRNIDPSIYVGRYVPEDQLYHPETNPTGIRATIYEAGKNVWGTDPETGFARVAVDNVGVQYGLRALEDGVITPEEFVVINEEVGGFDIDARHVPERMDALDEVIELAYTTGRILNGGQGLAEVPTLNLGLYRDVVELGADYHDRFRDFSVRARLLRENGHFDNHVMWHAHPAAIPADFGDLSRLMVMDEWVTAIGADSRDVAQAQKVTENRPADLTDRCTLADGSHHTVTQWPFDDSDNPCISGLPPAGDPRIAAGGPIANDVLKCQLKPLVFDDYSVDFTTEQQERLEAVFADGVCDWTRPGIEQRSPIATWLSFDTPGQPVPLG